MTYVFIGKSRSRSRLFLLSKIFLTWTYHKQKWLIQILGLKLSQNRSQDRFGTWYVHVKEIFDKRKKAWKKLALHRGSTGFRSQKTMVADQTLLAHARAEKCMQPIVFYGCVTKCCSNRSIEKLWMCHEMSLWAKIVNLKKTPLLMHIDLNITTAVFFNFPTF